jgi:two-component system, NarL family, response regulator LiaR
LAKNKQIIIYGLALAVLLFVLKWLETRYILLDQQLDTYLGIVAVLFTALGIWLAMKIRKPNVETVIIEKKVVLASGPDFILNEDEVRRLNLSKRELEVLQLMANGLSNQEIAERLFVSLNTIKTHSAQIFEKMEVKRRTQAVDMAKRLSIIP